MARWNQPHVGEHARLRIASSFGSIEALQKILQNTNQSTENRKLIVLDILGYVNHLKEEYFQLSGLHVGW